MNTSSPISRKPFSQVRVITSYSIHYTKLYDVYEKYKDRLLGVISDMRFPRDGVLNDMAGFDMISLIRAEQTNLPTVLQSSDPGNAIYATQLQANFINKNSETLLQDSYNFV